MARKSRKHLQNTPNEQKSIMIEKSYIAGVYTRTSSQEQRGDSIGNQKYIADQYIRENSDIELHKVYVDYGISSFERFRPGFEEMLLDIESKSINCIIVKDISRFNRDYLETGDYLQRKFPAWGVRFISVNDNYDSLRSDATQLGIALWSLLSYQYSINLSKNIQTAIAFKQKTGTYIPAKLPYGYRKIRSEQGVVWIQDENAAPAVQQIFKEALSGLSAFAIAGALNKQNIPAPSSAFWSSGSILRVLKNISYTGTFVTSKTRNNIVAGKKTIRLPSEDWIKHYGHHIPIIDELTFHNVQYMLANRHLFIPRQEKTEDFFCKKLYCGICGRKMRLKLSTNGNIYYICPRRDEASSSCPNKSKSEIKLKRQVFYMLSNKIKRLGIEFRDTLAYEKSPYFLKKTKKEDTMLQVNEQEINRLFHLFKQLYEESVINNTIYSTDIQELLRHLTQVRTSLQERNLEIMRARNEYQLNESSSSLKFQPYHMFCDYDELTQEMLDAMVVNLFVDLDGVRVEEKRF
ncbi:MAG: recombinase family protein [Oscillospiraceae bacterium]|nr:recombinase family protein [Oscillospiraceae bacterium]